MMRERDHESVKERGRDGRRGGYKETWRINGISDRVV